MTEIRIQPCLSCVHISLHAIAEGQLIGLSTVSHLFGQLIRVLLFMAYVTLTSEGRPA
jgi:hypothetical protein